MCMLKLFSILISIYFLIKISSSDLQRFVFGEQYAITEQDHSIEPTAKRLKTSSTNEENEEV